MVYHASLFMRLQGTGESQYGPGDVITDLAQATSVIIGYHGLGLVFPNGITGRPHNHHLIYIAALMVPVNGTVTTGCGKNTLSKISHW